MNRLFDIFGSLAILTVLAIPMALIAIIVISTSKGKAIFWSDRAGQNNLIFRMPKFRSMSINTPNKASDLLENPDSFITPFGKFLRRYSLDELPQLISVIKGDMSLVGPRPALFNQYELIELRTEYGIQKLMPGITGWAQVNGRDNLTIQNKIELEREYLQRKSIWLDIKILWMTLNRVLNKDGVSH